MYAEPLPNRPTDPPDGSQPHGAVRRTLVRKPVVLIVEDEDGPRAFYRRVFTPLSVEVLNAETGTRGLQLAIARQPQVVLVDLRLPELDSLQVIEGLRFSGVLAHVLVVSGFLTEELTARALSLGALEVLAKPVSPDVLVHAFHSVQSVDGPVGDGWREGLEGTAAERWVTLVLRSLQIPRDPRVTCELAARAATSLTQMKIVCREVDITPYETCSLARCIGGIVWARRLGTAFESLMNVGDQRTMDGLIARAGVEGRTATATVRDLLETQRFVSPTKFAFLLLRSALLGEPPPDARVDG